ncbi:hypothetical protein [Occultella gossypii]|uniref:Meckel syndrome type 1 protein n=1 Tax=Occultella gossypii TaxID=2800820 RepID=A0ABS7SDT0_9MICO|nr:hypothetical protein [Occultella gossypii]MBZ2198516.1 hypothetical protein [Occultella gossypii]
MSEEEDTSTAGLGERRRRREAERARARAAGLERPLSRRELRARDEALASGALQLGPDGPVPTPMSATSALSAHTAPSAATPASGGRRRAGTDARAAVVPSTTDAETDGGASAEPATTDPATDGAASAESPTTHPATEGRASAEPATGASDPSPADQSQAAQVPADPAPAPTPGAGAADEAPAAPAATASAADAASSDDSTTGAAPADDSAAGVPRAGAPSAESAATTGEFGAVSRRSLRAKQANADADPAAPEAPSERTSTGRRPVVRPPAAARATRGLDETGGLTPIQRAVRDLNAAPDAAPEPPRAEIVAERSSAATPGPLPTTDAASVWGSDAPDETAVLPVQSGEPAKAEADLLYDGGPLPSTRRSRRDFEAPAAAADVPAGKQDAVPPAAPVTAAEHEEAEDEDDAFDMRPRWASVISGEPEPEGDEQPQAVAAAGAREELFDDDFDDDDYDDDEEDEDDERTPGWLRALQIIVLILVGLVLGLLVWQVASGNVFGGDGLAALASGIGSAVGTGAGGPPAA